MDLVKAWAVGIGILIAGTVATLAVILITLTDVSGAGALLLWSGVPTVIVYGLAAFASAAVHPRPARDRRGRHVLAVVAPPVAVLLLTVPFSLGDTTAAAVAVTLAGAIAGTAAGWVLGDLVRRPRRQTGYFGA